MSHLLAVCSTRRSADLRETKSTVVSPVCRQSARKFSSFVLSDRPGCPGFSQSLLVLGGVQYCPSQNDRLLEETGC
jgi:hypothetical protein